MHRWIRSAQVLIAMLALTNLYSPVQANATGAARVRPFVTCATKTANALIVVFGYDNTTASPVEIPLGKRNRVAPTGSTNPPTTFAVGNLPAAFTSTFPTKVSPSWTIASGKTRLIARVSARTPTCEASALSPSSPVAAALTHGLTLTLDGKTTTFRFPVTVRPQNLDGQGHLMVAGFRPDLQAWSVLVGGNGLQVQFGWERQTLAVGTYPLGACPANGSCSSTPGSYTAIATDGRPETTLLAYEFPALNLRPVTLTISSISEAMYPSEDSTLAPVNYRYVKGTIEGKVATVTYSEAGPVLVRGPLDAKITFDIYLEELKK